MNLQKVEMSQLTTIDKIYTDIIEKTTNMEKYAHWKTGVYPTADDMKEYIQNNAMYQYLVDGNIAGVLAITMEQGSAYHEITWGIEAEDSEVSVIHILGVHPGYQKQGIGSRMIKEAIELGKTCGKKAIRLDALATNLPAQHLYQEQGFVYRGTSNLYAENTGWADFYYYEYII